MDAWDRMFMNMALAVARKSKDPRTKVGAILVSPDRYDVCIGFNGFPRRIPDDTEVLARRATIDGLTKDALVIHAEMNAILHCRQKPFGWTLYATHTPCRECAKFIVGAEITRVVTLGLRTTTDSNPNETAQAIFLKGGVQFEIASAEDS